MGDTAEECCMLKRRCQTAAAATTAAGLCTMPSLVNALTDAVHDTHGFTKAAHATACYIAL
jgi:hypothetical protein